MIIHKTYPKIFCACAGLYGAFGVAAYAASSHIGGYFTVIAPLLLIHAVALLALAFARPSNIFMRLAGCFMILGVFLFCLDMIIREYFSHRLFPFAAPFGGFIMIAAWLLLILVAFIALEKETD